jgi:tetratricopeptide (TPR) repeat protein
MTKRSSRKTPRWQTGSRHRASGGATPATIAAGAALLVVATFIAYVPSLHGGLLWDDRAYLTGPGLQALDGLRRIWFSPGATLQYYPVLYSAFWAEWQLWQADTFAYHLLKVAEHVLAACLLCGVLRRLRIPGAWFAAAAFALHPVSVESVAWISEQKNTLSAVFYFAAAWAYLRFDRDVRSAPWYLLALICFALAVLSKSVTATLPAVLLVLAWWQRGRLHLRRDLLPLIPWFILAAAAGAVTAWFERVVVGAQGGGFELGPIERLLLAARIVWFYLFKLLWPAELIFFYPRWMIHTADWTLWLSLVALVALIGALLWRGLAPGTREESSDRVRRAPAAALLVFIVTLVPVLGFLNVYPFRFSYVADHFQYLAQVSIFAMVAGALATMANRSKVTRHVVTAAAVAILTTCGWLTWEQSDQYGHDAVHHYQAILAHNPNAWIAYENWGGELMLKGDYDAAVPLLRKALAGQPDYFEATRDLAVSLERTGRLAEALPLYERAIERDPDRKGGENLYGTALLRQKRPAEAIPHLERAITLAEAEGNPIFMFYMDLGRAYVAVDRAEDGVTQFQRAREKAGPNYPLPDYDALLGDALVRLGRDTEATPYLRRAVDADADDAFHRLDLGRILYKSGRYTDAARYLADAAKLRPDMVDAYIGLAFTYHSLEKPVEARQTAAQAIEVARRVLPTSEAVRVAQTMAPLLEDR